jgi:large subunit ribosomal protein L3
MSEQAPEVVKSASRSETVLKSRRAGIFGVKAGMTQVYRENGDVCAVTVLDLSPNVVTQVKTKSTDGYEAVQVGFLEKAEKKVSRPEKGHAAKSGSKGFYHYQEFRLCSDEKIDGVTLGAVLSVDAFKVGDLVDLTAVSKGKGYQGGMKRFHMHGGNKTHGASLSHRSLGSIGNRADPAKCFKNKKMPGQMGNVKRTIQNVQVVAIDKENGCLLVHGSVPGSKNGVVTIRKAIKSVG